MSFQEYLSEVKTKLQELGFSEQVKGMSFSDTVEDDFNDEKSVDESVEAFADEWGV